MGAAADFAACMMAARSDVSATLVWSLCGAVNHLHCLLLFIMIVQVKETEQRLLCASSGPAQSLLQTCAQRQRTRSGVVSGVVAVSSVAPQKLLENRTDFRHVWNLNTFGILIYGMVTTMCIVHWHVTWQQHLLN